MTDPKNAKYLVHDPNIEETYYCESEAEALAIAKEALENIWPEKDEGIYIATLTVTPTHKTVIADEDITSTVEERKHETQNTLQDRDVLRQHPAHQRPRQLDSR